MDDNFQTSQQKAGEHQLAEGKSGGAATVDSSVDDGGGRGEWNKTSQQKRSEHDKPEGE